MSKIKDLPLTEMPRERFIKYGSSALSNQELIAIIIKTGTQHCNVKEVALKILDEVKNITDLDKLTINKLKQINGIGETKAITLLAAIELGKRISLNNPQTKTKLHNSMLVFNYFKNYFNNLKQEVLVVAFLDTKKNLISHKLIFQGTVDQSIAHPREIFKHAYLETASFIICMHNHPSGDINPSIADELFTINLLKIGEIMQIPVIDHIIFGHNNYYSFKEKGKIS